MEQLFSYSQKLIQELDSEFVRYIYPQINWENRLIGLVGPRGVGKTTLVLQHIKQNLNNARALYVTAEDFYFTKHKLLDLAKHFVQYGGTHLFIDEIHKYPDWSKELKLIYDYHKELKVVFTGSSVLDIKKGTSDLSRRAIMYSMQGLSFREYLMLFHEIHVPVHSLEQILNREINWPKNVLPLPLFKDYLKRGYYPFSLEPNFEVRLNQIINQTLEVDIPFYAHMHVATGVKLKQLLGIVSESVPFKPNMSKIAELLHVSRNNIADYLYYIQEAGLIALLHEPTQGIRALGKLNKIYLDNTNLAYQFSEGAPNLGNIRETFFLNQMRQIHQTFASNIGDFVVDKWHFELGGKNKKSKQLLGSDNGFLVKDDIEFGYLNVIPLWQFGLMY